MTTATLVSAAVAAFNEFVTKKNKKAAKLGLPAIKVEMSKPYIAQRINDNPNSANFNKSYFVELVDVTIDETQLKIGNFTVKGRIDNNDGAVIVTGWSDMKKYRNVSMSRCDHCNISRSRNHLVVLEDNQSNELVVGSACLKDYTGHATALQYLSHLSWIMELQDQIDELGFGESTEDNDNSARGTQYYENTSILYQAAAIIRVDGKYISGAKALDFGICSTKDAVMHEMFSKNPTVQYRVTEQDIEYVKSALEWFNSTEHDDSDFFYNLATIVNKGYVSTKHFGYIIALLPTYAIAMNKKTAAPASNHIANIGDKKVKIANAKCIRINPNMFGCWYTFVSNNNIVTYSTGAGKFELDEVCDLEATIKDHTVFNNVKQTVITRAKIV